MERFTADGTIIDKSQYQHWIIASVDVAVDPTGMTSLLGPSAWAHGPVYLSNLLESWGSQHLGRRVRITLELIE